MRGIDWSTNGYCGGHDRDQEPGSRKVPLRVVHAGGAQHGDGAGRLALHLGYPRSAVTHPPIDIVAIGDDGTTIFLTGDGSWNPLPEWQEAIAPDWADRTGDDLRLLFADIPPLTPQEDAKQNTFKLSFYAPEDTDRDVLLERMQIILEREGIAASLIWSIDEQERVGLLDVLLRETG